MKFALKETELGKSLNEALTNLRSRISSKSVDNLILSLIESNLYGNNILESLKTQVTYITDKRILKIKGDKEHQRKFKPDDIRKKIKAN